MKKNKGFTLIELLVVVAIIGILSSVILASLNNARDKGKDAAVKSQLSSMKAQAELYYSKGDELYTDICTSGKTDGGFGTEADPGLLQAVVNATAVDSTLVTSNDTAGALNTVTCHATEDAWAAEAPMNDGETMFCVDSTGVSKETKTSLSDTGAGQYNCR